MSDVMTGSSKVIDVTNDAHAEQELKALAGNLSTSADVEDAGGVVSCTPLHFCTQSLCLKPCCWSVLGGFTNLLAQHTIVRLTVGSKIIQTYFE